MTDTWTSFQPGLKEVWTQQEFELQFYDDHPFLDELEKTDSYTIGEYAIVPIETSRNGGFSVAGTAGSAALNAAGNVGLNQAQYSLAFNYQQAKIEHAAIAVSQGRPNAIAGVVDTALESASSNMRVQITRQAYADQSALICACVASSSGQTVLGLNTTTGYDALVRGQLEIGMTIDIGTTGNEVACDADKVISAVSIDATTPTVTLSANLAANATTSHYVSVANARSGATSLEMNGLGNIISTSAALGGLSAANRWKAASVDSATTDLTLDSMLAVQEQVMQNLRGKKDLSVLMGYKQGRRFYSLYQNQVRFQGDGSLEAGSVEDVKWNGMKIRQDADAPSTKVFYYQPSALLVIKSPLGVHWLNEAIAGGDKIGHVQNTTGFVGTLAYPINLAARRRNGMGAQTALT